MNDDVNDVKTNAAVGFRAGHNLAVAEATMHREGDGRPYRVLADGSIVNMEGYLLNPVMRRGDVAVLDAVSFGAYVNRFKEDATMVFADRLNRGFVGVLDYHEPGVDGLARWGRHRCWLQLRPTTSWSTWMAASKKPMAQAAFASFIEDNIPDIAEPNGATILTITRTLEAKKAVNFKSHHRAEDGSFHFLFSEDVQGTAAGGVKIPGMFQLGLIPFEGMDRYRIDARFKYRIDDGKPFLWFELVRPEDVLDTAYADELAIIQKAIGETPVLAGQAPAATKVE